LGLGNQRDLGTRNIETGTDRRERQRGQGWVGKELVKRGWQTSSWIFVLTSLLDFSQVDSRRIERASRWAMRKMSRPSWRRKMARRKTKY